jgi:hypothetical protein
MHDATYRFSVAKRLCPRAMELKKWVEASGYGVPGAMTSRCAAVYLLRAPVAVQVECRFAWRTKSSAYERTSLTVGWKLLEQGPESQLASAAVSGGVSAVISASDLDDTTVLRHLPPAHQCFYSFPGIPPLQPVATPYWSLGRQSWM